MGRFLINSIFFIIVKYLYRYLVKWQDSIKESLKLLCLSQIILFLLLFFMDPGTLIED
jgi:hypothetical protein